MATKKKLTPAECDRWDTIPGINKTTSKPTAEQKKLIAELNAKAPGKKSGKAKK